MEKNSLSNFICHLSLLKKVSPIHTHPLISIYEFLKHYELLFFWVWVICKRLNVNWEKIHSIIFCHFTFLEKLSPTHTHPPISIHEFLKPYDWLFLEFESFVKGWMWIGKNSLSNFICHLSFLKKISPTHTHPLISICECSTP